MSRKKYPSDETHNSARARKRSDQRAVNVATHGLTTAGESVPEGWGSWSLDQQLAWARRRLCELAGTADSEMVQSVAANALARSLGTETLAKSKERDPTKPETGPMTKAYLLALKAEVDEKLAELDGEKH